MSWAVFQADWVPRWEEVLTALGNTNPHLSTEWLGAWWRAFGTPGREEVLLARDGAGAPRGVLFTHRTSERYCGLPVHSIRAWINGQCQRAGLSATAPRATAAALIDYWFADCSRWDLLRLEGLPCEGGFPEALLAESARRGGTGYVSREWAHIHLAVDRPWREYLRSFPRKKLHGPEGRRRRWAERGTLTWHKAANSGEVSAALERYLELEERSWKRGEGETILGQAALTDFYRELAARLGPRGGFEVDLLCFEGEPVAGVLSLLYHGRLVTLKISYNEAFRQYSPGWQVFKDLLENAFDRGLAEVDIYSDTFFARQWGRDERRFCDLMVSAPTLRGRAIVRAKRWLNTLGLSLRRAAVGSESR